MHSSSQKLLRLIENKSPVKISPREGNKNVVDLYEYANGSIHLWSYLISICTTHGKILKPKDDNFPGACVECMECMETQENIKPEQNIPQENQNHRRKSDSVYDELEKLESMIKSLELKIKIIEYELMKKQPNNNVIGGGSGYGQLEGRIRYHAELKDHKKNL